MKEEERQELCYLFNREAQYQKQKSTSLQAREDRYTKIIMELSNITESQAREIAKQIEEDSCNISL